jgi:CDP-glycerol glycerophosphotransferase (TagB/SpsB family)
MNSILFCNLPYAFSILKPLADELTKQNENYIWYIPKDIIEQFPYTSEPHTSKIEELERFKADAIFVPGNDVPYWLRGVKVQIFHGLAGEKKGHFKIRDYFDLYLTQGPYFTDKFTKLSLKHKNFEVKETGWCKLDRLYAINEKIKNKKDHMLSQYGAKYIVLYSPTFSPSLTSVEVLYNIIQKLGEHKDILVLIKFHDKMDDRWVEKYKNITSKNILIVQSDDITESLQIADLMISDTSSVVYEFTLLDKPVVTFKSRSKNINWCNIINKELFYDRVIDIVVNGNDQFSIQRKQTIAQYHPYSDGKSSKRVIEATKEHISIHGVPNKRDLPWHRKLKLKKIYLN